jgi:hypothetical protein
VAHLGAFPGDEEALGRRGGRRRAWRGAGRRSRCRDVDLRVGDEEALVGAPGGLCPGFPRSK